MLLLLWLKSSKTADRTACCFTFRLALVWCVSLRTPRAVSHLDLVAYPTRVRHRLIHMLFGTHPETVIRFFMGDRELLLGWYFCAITCKFENFIRYVHVLNYIASSSSSCFPPLNRGTRALMLGTVLLSMLDGWILLFIAGWSTAKARSSDMDHSVVRLPTFTLGNALKISPP